MPQRRFEHAKGMTRATCYGEQAMCTESFGNTDASDPPHCLPCLAISSSGSVSNVFCCACGRRGSASCGERGGLDMQIMWKTISALVRRLDAY